jgi:hypothetical protein
MKQGMHGGDSGCIDKRSLVRPGLIKSLQKTGAAFGLKFSVDDVTAVNLAHTALSVYTAVWLETFFKLVGDKQPNTHSEIHLEKQEKKSIYEEYKKDFEYQNRKPMSLSHFLKLWRDAFPHVKIRAYKQVSGKCYVCLILGLLRSKFRDSRRRELVNVLHAYHQTTYMKERYSYYKRAEKACNHPEDFYSDISDGMASNKTKCPHNGDKYDFKPALPIHIQGQLAHGRSLDLFRSFHNLSVGSNVATHCWLICLEREYKANMLQSHGRIGLPDTLYHQIDGGSENTAKAALAVCELLVARRLTNKVVLSRLPVGHTHEDIDSIFALIWRDLMNNDVMTPQQYAKTLVAACENKEKNVNVFDLWVVPDYKKYFEKFISPSLGRYAKGKWSQLQITFEAIDISNQHPLGVKVSHRAFCSDDVYILKKLPLSSITHRDHATLDDSLLSPMEIEVRDSLERGEFAGVLWDTDIPNAPPINPNDIRVGTAEADWLGEQQAREEDDEDDGREVEEDDWKFSLGYTPVKLISHTYPTPDMPSCYILKELPHGNIEPQPFVAGSRLALEKVLSSVAKKVGNILPGVVTAWNEFEKSAPQTDDVQDWLVDHPLYIPFRVELFGLDDDIDIDHLAVCQKNHDKRVAGKRKRQHDNSMFPEEVWEAQPSMMFTGVAPSSAPYKRLRTSGERSTAVTAESESDDESIGSSSEEGSGGEDTDRWCTVRRNTVLRGYGNANGYPGRRFICKGSLSSSDLDKGMIVSIVRKRSFKDGSLHFKCVGIDSDVSATRESDFHYIECKKMMSRARGCCYSIVPIASEHETVERRPPPRRPASRRTWCYVNQDTGEEIPRGLVEQCANGTSCNDDDNYDDDNHDDDNHDDNHDDGDNCATVNHATVKQATVKRPAVAGIIYAPSHDDSDSDSDGDEDDDEHDDDGDDDDDDDDYASDVDAMMCGTFGEDEIDNDVPSVTHELFDSWSKSKKKKKVATKWKPSALKAVRTNSSVSSSVTNRSSGSSSSSSSSSSSTNTRRTSRGAKQLQQRNKK